MDLGEHNNSIFTGRLCKDVAANVPRDVRYDGKELVYLELVGLGGRRTGSIAIGAKAVCRMYDWGRHYQR